MFDNLTFKVKVIQASRSYKYICRLESLCPIGFVFKYEVNRFYKKVMGTVKVFKRNDECTGSYKNYIPSFGGIKIYMPSFWGIKDIMSLQDYIKTDILSITNLIKKLCYISLTYLCHCKNIDMDSW